MWLTKEGLVPEPGDRETPPERPSTTGELLHRWLQQLEVIEEGYTFGDLVALLRDVEDVDALSSLFWCDVRAFLLEARRPRKLEAASERLQYVTVCNVADLTTYVPDPSEADEDLEWMDEEEAAEHDRVVDAIASLTGEPEPRKIVDASGDDPLTGEPSLRRMKVPAQHGTWTPPYIIRRDFVGWGQGEAYGLTFSPISTLLDVPLRYDPDVEFWPDNQRTGEPLFKTQLTITFGEFLTAIFDEIGFHGSPAERDETLAEVDARVEAIRRLHS